MTALQPFSDEQLNFFKFSSLVLNEFPKALRQTFKTMWDNTYGHRPGFQLWDDSTTVRNLFAATEGGKTKVPVLQSYNEWDCTSLFQATIFAWSFALPASTGSFTTLSDLYVKPCAVPYGSFHACVVSPGGNMAETFALAIDQLRLLRNSLCHSTSSEMDKPTFDQRVNYTRDAFQALGVSTAPIDAVVSLAKSDFPTNEIRKLEARIRDETRAFIKCLEDFREGLESLKQRVEVENASKDDITRLEKKIDELKAGRDEHDNLPDNSGTRPSLSIPSLPSMVPNFTGRQSEVEEIIRHVTSESTRLVSIWGSPGFGKTSVAIAVGHALQTQGLPVYWVSLRGLESKAGLTSKILSLLTQSTSQDKKPSDQRLSLDDEICQLFSEISKQSAFILDNADDLLESGWPKVKEEVMLLEEILRQNPRVTFIVTTRESLEFMDVHFQGHRSLRIGKLGEASAQTLIYELLPHASVADCREIAQLCGQVPLAMKLVCSLISEDSASPRHFLDNFMTSSSENIVKLRDNQDYPTSYRLYFVVDSSFQRLSEREKEALISLSILPENFSTEVAAAILGTKTSFEAERMLQILRRKSLIDSSSKPGTFTMHKLLQSFLREKGNTDMKETILNAKDRLNAFYVSHFDKLNEQFLNFTSLAPSEILARGRPAIEAYRRALLEGKGYARRVPVMIIGQARTGKTSLKKSLKGELFNPNEGSTEGIETDPSYFKVSTDVWRTSKNSKDTESEPTFSFEHQTAQLIVERLKERKRGSSNAEELSPNTSNAATEPSNAIEEAKEFSNEPSSISKIELSPQDSNSEEPSGERMTPSRQVSHDHLRVPKLPEDIAALVQRLLEKNRNDKDDIYSIIWDFGGQSVYYDTHPIFLTRKAIYILACNLSYDPYQKADSPTKKGMGGNMDDVRCSKTNLDYLDFWMSSVYSLVRPDVVSQELIVSENLPTVFLACTHADKKSQNANPSKIYDSLKDKVYKELLKGLFVVDNTKSGSGDECQGVNKLREKVLSIAKKFPQMEEAIPLKWLKFEKVLYLLSQEGYKWIPIEKARQIAIDECGIADDEQTIRTLLNFLHDQRVLINFTEPPELKSMVILSPQWLIDVFKEVITVKSWEEVDEDYGELWRSFQKTGILDENLLDHAWRSLVDTQKTDKSILISMMESFNLLCPWPSDGTVKQYLVPSMLQSPPTEDVLKHLDYVRTPSLFVAFDSGRVPPGLFSRLVLQFYRLCQEEWKSKIKPELFNNFAMFHILPNRAISLVFMLRSSSIEIVFHVGSDSRDLHTSRAIYSQLKCRLENIRKMSFWLQHMRYELCVCCPVCSEEGSRCRAHDVRGCECLHLLSECKLRDNPYCDRPGIRGDPTININTFEHWFALSESQGSGIPLSQQDATQRDNNEEHRITPKKETGLERSTTDPPEVIIKQLKNQDLPKNVTHFDDCQLPVDFLLLTVEDCELLSCLSCLNPDFCKTYRSDLGFVYLGDVGEDEKKLNIAVMSCYKGSASPGGSIVVVLNAVKVLRPKAVFCVGSCRSLNYDKVKLGDIVMFEKLITCGPCKITESGIEERGVKVPLKSGLLKVILRACDGWKPPLKGPKPLEVKPHRGTILSGPVEVIDSPKHCKALVDRFPEALAMEEEGEGVFAAAHDLDIEWIVIKGISDYAGGSKSKEMSWRPFASLMAASVTAHILSDANVFQDWPHFESTSVEKCRNCESRMKRDAQIPWGRWFDETKINIVVAGLVCLIAVVLFFCFGSN